MSTISSSKVVTEKPQDHVQFICKNKIASIKNKTIITAYCESPCFHVAELTDQKRCGCCGIILKHKQTYEAFRDKFEEIIEDNPVFLDAFRELPSKPENRFYAFVKNGYYTYIVDMKFFEAYRDLAIADKNNMDGQDKYNRFFTVLKNTCPRFAGKLNA